MKSVSLPYSFFNLFYTLLEALSIWYSHQETQLKFVQNTQNKFADQERSVCFAQKKQIIPLAFLYEM